MKRILALDIGEVRVGIATGNTKDKIAFPVCVLPTKEVLQNAKSFKRILEDHEPDLLLSGLPLSLSGEHGPQAQLIKAQAEHIAKNCQLPLLFHDERLSSAEAKRSMKEQGMNEAQMRGKVDMIAASLFLQSWLDTNSSD